MQRRHGACGRWRGGAGSGGKQREGRYNGATQQTRNVLRDAGRSDGERGREDVSGVMRVGPAERQRYTMSKKYVAHFVLITASH